MKKLLTLIIIVATIFSCAGGMALAGEKEDRELLPESVDWEDRIFFVAPSRVKEITYENGKAIFAWSQFEQFTFDLDWDEKGTEVYFVVDPEEKRDSSGRLLNSNRMPATLLTKDNIKDIRIFDGKTYVPNDGIVTFSEDGKGFISREYIDKGYSMFIEEKNCDGIHYDITQMQVSTGYGKGKVSHIPNGWYIDYDDIPKETEDGSKILYILLPQIFYEKTPVYTDVFSDKGTPKLSLIGEPKSSNGYWVYTVKIPRNFDKTIGFLFDYGQSENVFARMGVYINPSTEKPAEVPAQPEPLDVKESLESAKIITKTYKVTKGTKVKCSVASVDIEALEEEGYTLKLKYYRSTKKTSGYKLQATRDLGKTYTNSKGTSGKKYYYKVRLAVYDETGKLVEQTALKQSTVGERTFKK